MIESTYVPDASVVGVHEYCSPATLAFDGQPFELNIQVED